MDLGHDPGVWHHPSEELLLRFVRGETVRAETREVVRHLLTGCRECRTITGPAWGIGALTRALYQREQRKEEGMTEMDPAKAQLRRVVEDLRAVRYRLLGIQASIRPTRQETSLEDLEGEPDAPTEIRAVIAHALHDRLDPLIRDLMAAAGE